MASDKITKALQGFSKLDREKRYKKLVDLKILKKEDVAFLSSGSQLSLDLAEKFIENVVGYLSMPLGIAVNFRLDQKDYFIPMAVEETSIIAAASKNAKWVRDHGELTTEVVGDLSIGQIQLAKVENFTKFEERIYENKNKFIEDVNQHVLKKLTNRGGGMRDLSVRHIKRHDGYSMAVIHIFVDTCDAMGANMITQACEYLKHPIETLTGEQVTMCILSNLNDSKITKAKVIINNIDPELGNKIQEASYFAELDPYRAATHNKGVCNGMDPVLVATGNDWRAVSAAVHAYAARDGQYRAISQWRMHGNDLIGKLAAPISVGIVGGMTKLHPVAQIALDILNIKSADKLSRIVAASGIILNLASISALTTFGFIEGHMKLHINNLILSAGANEKEAPILKQKLETQLADNNRVSLTNAIEYLSEIRVAKKPTKVI